MSKDNERSEDRLPPRAVTIVLTTVLLDATSCDSSQKQRQKSLLQRALVANAPFFRTACFNVQ